MRYRLHEHSAFPAPLSKEDLILLLERGSLSRGDVCTDTLTGRDHTVGDVIGNALPGRLRAARLARPLYREFRADAPGTDTEEDAELEAIPEPEPPESGDRADLMEGEEVLHHSHPSWLGAGKALFLVILLVGASLMLAQIEPIYAIMTGSCAGLLLLGVVVVRGTKHYYVTDERVELIWGILGKSSREVRICDIRSIDVYESGLKGLLGLGTVDFSSAANSGIEVQFRDIRKAHEVKELVRQLQRASR